MRRQRRHPDPRSRGRDLAAAKQPAPAGPAPRVLLIQALFPGLLLACSSLFALASAFPNGVSSGDTTFTTTVLWARSSSAGTLRFTVASDPAFQSPISIGTETVADPAVPAKHLVDQLQPGTRYYYQVAASSGEACDGRFRTPARPGGLHGVRFGVAGDWRGELRPYPAVKNVAARNLDFFVKLGDTVYADIPSLALAKPRAQTLEEFRIKHDEVYSSRFGLNVFAQLHASTSIFAMIDDHEVANDFAGGAPPATDGRFQGEVSFINETGLYRNGLQAFVEYNAIGNEIYPTSEHPRFHAKPKLYRTQTYGSDAALFLVDARSFRDPPLPPVQNPTDPREIATFVTRAFDIDPATGMRLPQRTMLGRVQFDQLTSDLLAADRNGITWKFVCVPEPVQNLGAAGASDRFEGYASERAELLGFIEDHAINNVVFIAADIHGSAINNLTYRAGPDLPLKPTGAFEISTPAVAFDPPFGPKTLTLAQGIPVTPDVSLLDVILLALGLPDRAAFDGLPVPAKNTVITGLINGQLRPLGLDLLGLDPSPIRLQTPPQTNGVFFDYGWTQFEIAPDTQDLTVTTYGIDFYSIAEVGPGIIDREPEVRNRFVISPQGPHLTAAIQGNALVISWPSTALEFQLESSAQLGRGARWQTVQAAKTVQDGRNQVKLPPRDGEAGPSRFFRLSRATGGNE